MPQELFSVNGQPLCANRLAPGRPRLLLSAWTGRKGPVLKDLRASALLQIWVLLSFLLVLLFGRCTLQGKECFRTYSVISSRLLPLLSNWRQRCRQSIGCEPPRESAPYVIARVVTWDHAATEPVRIALRRQRIGVRGRQRLFLARGGRTAVEKGHFLNSAGAPIGQQDEGWSTARGRG